MVCTGKISNLIQPVPLWYRIYPVREYSQFYTQEPPPQEPGHQEEHQDPCHVQDEACPDHGPYFKAFSTEYDGIGRGGGGLMVPA